LRLNTDVLPYESTLVGEEIAMTIEASSMGHIMGVLTKMYPKPALAVLREYSTNARDSHIERGCADRPIEVTLPSPLSPFLKIRDYGVGMDAEDIRETYSRYGASTKRDTDEQTGALGLGCKSGLAYAQQFTLSGIKGGARIKGPGDTNFQPGQLVSMAELDRATADGERVMYTEVTIRTEIVVSRKKDGGGGMTLIPPYETGDEQGVEIVVPAVHVGDFADHARDLFRFWPEGSVLVDGRAPRRVDGLWIADDLLLTEETEEPVTVVMGGVPYPAPNQYRYRGAHHLVAFVPMGAVNFTPNREQLVMDGDTPSVVRELLRREEEEKQPALRALVADADSAPEAARVAQQAARMGLKGDAEWRGEVVPRNLEGGGKFITAPVTKTYRQKNFHEYKQVVNGASQFWLGGFPNPAFTPYKRQKLDQWWEKNRDRLVPEGEDAPETFVIVAEVPQEVRQWVDDDKILPWAQVEAEKISKPRATGSRGSRAAGTYDAWVPDQGYVRDADPSVVPVTSLFYYLGTTGWEGQFSKPPAVGLVRSREPDAVVFALPGNRLAKFLRENPGARQVGDHARELAQEWADALTEDDLLALSMNGSTPGVVRRLDPERVEDPDLVRAIGAAKRHDAVAAAARSYGDWVTPREIDGYDPGEVYPLLSTLGPHSTPHDHVYLYVNAAYAAREDQT
jgi:hypothetical protein